MRDLLLRWYPFFYNYKDNLVCHIIQYLLDLAYFTIQNVLKVLSLLQFLVYITYDISVLVPNALKKKTKKNIRTFHGNYTSHRSVGNYVP